MLHNIDKVLGDKGKGVTCMSQFIESMTDCNMVLINDYLVQFNRYICDG